MNTIYRTVLGFYNAGLKGIYRFSNWRIERLSERINEKGDADFEDSGYYELVNSRDFWSLLSKTLEAKLQHAN